MRTAERRGVPAQLAEHLVFAGDDLSAAQHASSRVFCAHSVRPLHRDEPIEAFQYAAQIGAVTLSYIGYGAAVEIVATENPDRFFCIQLPNGGRAEITSGAQQIVSTPRVASVPTPSETLRMRWEPAATHRVIKIDYATVERYLGQLLGHIPETPVQLLLGLDTGSLQGGRWLAIEALLLAELASAGDPAPGASTAAVQDLILSSLLLGHPNNYWDELHRLNSTGRRPYVHRAIEYATANLNQPLTIGELAEIGGISVRALQAGFRENVGCSPTTWIRNQRLDKVRAELEVANPGDKVRVTDVALRWGFSHFGRFSQVYRQRFGEVPSKTLRR